MGGTTGPPYARRQTVLARRPDRPGAAEAEPRLRRRGEVELAVAGVRAAVDDRHADGPPAVAQRPLRPARQRLVGHAERAGRERPAAREVRAVEPRAVPRGRGRAVDAQKAHLVVGARVAGVAAEEDAQRPGA